MKILPAKVVNTTSLHALAETPIKLEIRKVLVKLREWTLRRCLQHGRRGLKVVFCESTTNVKQLKENFFRAFLVAIRLCQFSLGHFDSQL
jgi:hypothetical protein